MLSKIQSLGCRGVSGYAVSVECHVSNGLPGFDIVGLPDAAVKEARERVRSAIKTNGMKFPVSRLTVNLAPADTRKAGTLYDLPVLLGILCATGEIRQPPATAAFFGEVSLAGEIRPVTGALTMALAAEQIGLRELFVPAGNAAEAAFAEGVTVYPVENISQLVHHLRGEKPIAPMPPPAFSAAPHFAPHCGQVLSISIAAGLKHMVVPFSVVFLSFLDRRFSRATGWCQKGFSAGAAEGSVGIVFALALRADAAGKGRRRCSGAFAASYACLAHR